MYFSDEIMYITIHLILILTLLTNVVRCPGGGGRGGGGGGGGGGRFFVGGSGGKCTKKELVF